ncbi:type II toxin-antitoxin system VapC family toxin [Candidatus Tisiphia endosymbiont of Micropterix aruncella]|uniref:type II toxin-antitoxin system VapC family toxin n=1 Tax=Candidatus Tisiphia endosymbiont of Micropterix aruncella TaxID=3066271 RepID=UPI003AA86DA5
MSYLLDTHTLLWWLEDNPTLTVESRKIISNPNNLIFVSSVNSWEITIKKALGKLEAPNNLEQVILESGFYHLPININHTIFVEKLENYHDDPFDRLLISQAIIEGLTIITRDNKITQYSVPIIIA